MVKRLRKWLNYHFFVKPRLDKYMLMVFADIAMTKDEFSQMLDLAKKEKQYLSRLDH